MNLRDVQKCAILLLENMKKIDFRNLVRSELNRRGWSAYRLAQEASLPIRGVQTYIEGTRDMKAERLAAVLNVLGYEISMRKD